MCHKNVSRFCGTFCNFFMVVGHMCVWVFVCVYCCVVFGVAYGGVWCLCGLFFF